MKTPNVYGFGSALLSDEDRPLYEQNYLAPANCEYNDYLRGIREKIGGIDLKRPYTSDRDDWIQCMVLAGLGFTISPSTQ